MAYSDIATKAELASELRTHAKTAAAHEMIFAHVDAVLAAIFEGGLLDATPETEADRTRHNAATHLLSDIGQKLRAFEDRPCTDLSISLEVLAADLTRGGSAVLS